MKTSSIRVIFVLFTAACLYLWVLIPAVRIALTLIVGQDTAESVAFSMMAFHPVDIFYTVNIPHDWLGRILYFTYRASELIAFSVTYTIALHLMQHGRFNKMRLVYIVLICTIAILTALFFVGGGGGIIPCLAALSGMVLAYLFLRYRHSRLIEQTLHVSEHRSRKV